MMERRVKYWDIDMDQLLRIFRLMAPGNHLRCNGIPEDARVIGVTHNDIMRPYLVKVFLESAEFPLVPEGCVPESLEPDIFGATVTELTVPA